MTLAKSSPTAPLSAFIAPADIWEVMIPNPIIHSTTFGGNPMACAAGIAAIEVTLEEDLPGQAAAKGEFLLRELAALRERYPQVLVDAHGLGLLIGMEFPTDQMGFACAAGLKARGAGSRHFQGADHPDRTGVGDPDDAAQEMPTGWRTPSRRSRQAEHVVVEVVEVG
jgi:acetylornithine/succinyldiaminopimelate/putrescine aminotransferase